MKEAINFLGKTHIVLYDEHGRVKDERFQPNKLTRIGRDWLCAHISGGHGATQMGFIAIGCGGATAAASTQTGLYGETSRKSATYAHTANTASFSLVRTWVAGEATGSVDEAGIFSKEAAGGATILCRQTFGVIIKAAADTLKVTWTVDLGAIA